jgi:hypothetical protein
MILFTGLRRDITVHARRVVVAGALALATYAVLSAALDGDGAWTAGRWALAGVLSASVVLVFARLTRTSAPAAV